MEAQEHSNRMCKLKAHSRRCDLKRLDLPSLSLPSLHPLSQADHEQLQSEMPLVCHRSTSFDVNLVYITASVLVSNRSQTRSALLSIKFRAERIILISKFVIFEKQVCCFKTSASLNRIMDQQLQRHQTISIRCTHAHTKTLCIVIIINEYS